jgi:transposase-like protein
MMVMTKSKMANRYAPEVRMVFEHQGSYETQAGAIAAIAPKIGCIPQTLRDWVKQAEKDSGMRDGVTTEERDRIKALEREVRELRQANEILRNRSRVCQSAARWRSGPKPTQGTASLIASVVIREKAILQC